MPSSSCIRPGMLRAATTRTAAESAALQVAEPEQRGASHGLVLTSQQPLLRCSLSRSSMQLSMEGRPGQC